MKWAHYWKVLGMSLATIGRGGLRMFRIRKLALAFALVLALTGTACSEADLMSISTGGPVSFETGFDVDSLDQLLANFFFVAIQFVGGMQYGGI